MRNKLLGTCLKNFSSARDSFVIFQGVRCNFVLSEGLNCKKGLFLYYLDFEIGLMGFEICVRPTLDIII